VLLVVPDMKPAMQMQLDYDLRTRAGARLSSSLYLTVRAVDPMNIAAAGFGSVDWRASARRAASRVGATVASASSAENGAQIYQRAGCIACHSIDGVTAGKTGPTFKGLYGSQVKLANKPARLADDAYLIQSILEPATDIVQGYEPGMPSFKGVLSDADVRSMVLYIRSLK
jgi:mono/diheme cytochrome c family protein